MTYEILDKQTEGYLGLRMTADEFLALPEDPRHYELVDGVVMMSPSPAYWHQKIIAEILWQFGTFLRANPIGEIVSDIDVKLSPRRVYRPDIIYLSREKAAGITERITVIPDLVVEISSPDSRGYDSRTKRKDYESAGVGEYWLIDAKRETFTFLVLRDGVYQEAGTTTGRYGSSIIPGFELDLDRIRALF